ncbi:MAG: protein kinase [Verrucomicrobiota bacterium]
MKPDARREAALFQAAAQLAAEDRASFLQNACAGDVLLRQRLDALLAAHDAPDGVLAEPAAPAVRKTMKIELADEPDETVGQKIGRYKILEKVGEGGCGVVYVAEQTEPVRRRVALKVIKLGMDTRAVVARFEAERQALALMDHPNIARVLDAGSTETGRPYFVMELVRGIRITDYCDQNKLPTRDRLELFIKICQAIQHAHQKGIIHRDIKPSNILVTLHDGVPVPKVIDFGIAKATEGKLVDATVYTQLHQFIGTPAYMSPEQAEMSGLDIDTRSDIYSLGVLLYELLTGLTPFDARELMSQGIDAMRRTIREQDPLRPSTRLATLRGEQLTTTARCRSAESSRLLHQLRGDLDWIVMKCLEKDRTRRYETANGLAFDLKRHLTNEPVLARPPSRLYEFQKTVRRHHVGFAAAGAVMLALLCGALVSTWQMVRAKEAGKKALAAQESETAQRRKAEANEAQAHAAQAAEAKLREEAQAHELAARQRAYASDMNVAIQALLDSNLGRALELLNRQRPMSGQQDLRGWEWRYLWQQTRSDAQLTLGRESTEIVSLAASADGNWLAVGGYHRSGIAVWDLRTRKETWRLAADEDYVRAAFSPTEPLLAFSGAFIAPQSSDQNTLRICNPLTGRIIAEWPLKGVGTGLAFSSDGKTLATFSVGQSGSQITLWHMPDGTKIATYPGRTSTALKLGDAFACTPDLTLAAYSFAEDSQASICLVDLRTGAELWTAPAARNYVTALAFSPDGKTLVSGAGFDDSTIRLWDVATGKESGQLQGHLSWVGGLAFLDGGKQLVSSSADQTIRIWDLAEHKCLETMRGHSQEVWRVIVMPDQKTLVSGAKDGTVCLWDASVPHPHQSRTTFAPGVVAWGFAGDGRSVWTLQRTGEVAKWSPSGERQPGAFRVTDDTALSSELQYWYLFSKKGRWLAVGSMNGIIKIWDLERGTVARVISVGTGEAFPTCFSPDESRFCGYSGTDNSNHEWDLATGREIQSWADTTDSHCGDISPDGRFITTISFEGEPAVQRDLVLQKSSRVNVTIREGVSARYSPDGKLFALASDLGVAPIWHTADWTPAATLGSFFNGTHSVDFSPDGRRFAVSSDDKEAVRLYDTDGWQNVFTLQAPGTGFLGARFSGDGNNLVWGNQKCLQLWQAPSWQEIAAAEARDKEIAGQP